MPLVVLSEHGNVPALKRLLLTMKDLLEVRDLRVHYRTAAGERVTAVDGANLRMAPGEILGVLGESGSGKSTLASSLLALFAANASVEGGEVLFAGNDFLKMNSSQLAGLRGERIAIIFQEPAALFIPRFGWGNRSERCCARMPNLPQAIGGARRGNCSPRFFRRMPIASTLPILTNSVEGSGSPWPSTPWEAEMDKLIEEQLVARTFDEREKLYGRVQRESVLRRRAKRAQTGTWRNAGGTAV